MSLDPSLAAMLRQHRRLQAAQQAAAGPEWFDGDFVFTNDLGRPVAPMTLVRDWHLLLESIGLPRVPFHTARHTAATLMLSSGVSPRVAAERLGHSTVSITLDRYSHVTESLRKDAAMAIDRALREAGYKPDPDRGSNPPERQARTQGFERGRGVG
jgi:integrase